jgi:hypothetical protein
MALTDLRRNNNYYGTVSSWIDEWKDLVDSFLLDASSLNNNVVGKKRKGKQTEEEDEKWTLEDIATRTVSRKNDNLDNDVNDTNRLQQLQQLTNTLQKLKQFVCIALPRIISRIVHATAPILHELSRGYFVPFLTVALGCLGRIHSLLTKIGREATSILQETVSRLRNFYLKDKTKATKSMDREMMMRGSLECKTLKELIMTSFVVEDIGKRNKRQVFSPQQQPLPSTPLINHEKEWNNLMEHYVDVSQDELTKNINDFLKGKRWDDAMLKFGLGADSKLGLGDISSKLISSQEQTNANRESDELVLDVQNRETQFADMGGHLKTAIHSDTGELVNAHDSFDTIKLKQNSTYTLDDENMSRIKNERIKRQMIEAVSSTGATTSKKKKKKKKQTDKIDDLISADDDNNDETDSLAVTSVLSSGDSTVKRSSSLKTKSIKKKKRKSTSVIDDIFK